VRVDPVPLLEFVQHHSRGCQQDRAPRIFEGTLTSYSKMQLGKAQPASWALESGSPNVSMPWGPALLLCKSAIVQPSRAVRHARVNSSLPSLQTVRSAHRMIAMLGCFNSLAHCPVLLPATVCRRSPQRGCMQLCSTHQSAVMCRLCAACCRRAESGGQQCSSAQQATWIFAYAARMQSSK
jgi:hypothetical protein